VALSIYSWTHEAISFVRTTGAMAGIDHHGPYAEDAVPNHGNDEFSPFDVERAHPG
jgi:hypothetical protein